MSPNNYSHISGLYLILDQQYTKKDIVSIAEEALDAGVDVIQYREKGLSKKDAIKIAEKLRTLTAKAAVTFIINDDPVLALAVDADGVHLGQEDIPVHIARRILGKDKIIGLSTHSYQEAIEANSLEINYIGFGPIFQSRTKMVTSPLGIDAIRMIRDSITVPIIAIGGISDENVADVIKGGAAGVAVISAILSATDIKKSICKFKERMREVQIARQ